MEKLTDKLAEIVSSLQGPGWEAAKGAASVEAMSVLASGAICTVVAIGCGLFTYRAVKHVIADTDHDDIGWFIGAICAGLTTGITGIRALWAFLDPWTWAALTHPELWLAKRALGL